MAIERHDAKDTHDRAAGLVLRVPRGDFLDTNALVLTAVKFAICIPRVRDRNGVEGEVGLYCDDLISVAGKLSHSHLGTGVIVYRHVIIAYLIAEAATSVSQHFDSPLHFTSCNIHLRTQSCDGFDGA